MVGMNTWQRWKGIMKAYPFEEKRLNKWEPPYIVQPKFDGIRCRALPLKDAGKFILLSSEENMIGSVPHIEEELDFQVSKIHELDGELYCHGMSFEGITSITSRTANLHPEHKKISFYVFDIADEEMHQTQRLIQLNVLIPLNNPYIKLAPYTLCNNLKEIEESFNRFVSQGYEGIIVRHAFNQYIRRRSTFVMKFKPKREDEYRIVDVEEEIDKDGRPKDSLGALVCESGDGLRFNVGTGFTREQRQQLWDVKRLIVGLDVKVKYQHLTHSAGVPRFPVFVDVIARP